MLDFSYKWMQLGSLAERFDIASGAVYIKYHKIS